MTHLRRGCSRVLVHVILRAPYDRREYDECLSTVLPLLVRRIDYTLTALSASSSSVDDERGLFVWRRSQSGRVTSSCYLKLFARPRTPHGPHDPRFSVLKRVFIIKKKSNRKKYRREREGKKTKKRRLTVGGGSSVLVTVRVVTRRRGGDGGSRVPRED